MTENYYLSDWAPIAKYFISVAFYVVWGMIVNVQLLYPAESRIREDSILCGSNVILKK